MHHSSHFLSLLSSFPLSKRKVNLNKAAKIHHQNSFQIIDLKRIQNPLGHATHSFHTQYQSKNSYKNLTIFGMVKWELKLTESHMKLDILLKDMLLQTANAKILSKQRVKLSFMTGIKSIKHSE